MRGTAMQGGGEQELFSVNADVTPLLDALSLLEDGLVNAERAVTLFAESFAKMDIATMPFAQVMDSLVMVEEALTSAGVPVQEFYTKLFSLVKPASADGEALAALARREPTAHLRLISAHSRTWQQ